MDRHPLSFEINYPLDDPGMSHIRNNFVHEFGPRSSSSFVNPAFLFLRWNQNNLVRYERNSAIGIKQRI